MRSVEPPLRVDARSLLALRRLPYLSDSSATGGGAARERSTAIMLLLSSPTVDWYCSRRSTDEDNILSRSADRFPAVAMSCVSPSTAMRLFGEIVVVVRDASCAADALSFGEGPEPGADRKRLSPLLSDVHRCPAAALSMESYHMEAGAARWLRAASAAHEGNYENGFFFDIG